VRRRCVDGIVTQIQTSYPDEGHMNRSSARRDSTLWGWPSVYGVVCTDLGCCFLYDIHIERVPLCVFDVSEVLDTRSYIW